MTIFARELERLRKERTTVSWAELSRMSGVDQATISRVRSGEQSISFPDVDRIAVALGDSPLIHARLLKARLLEQCNNPGGKLLSITIRGEQTPAPDHPQDNPWSNLPPSIEADLTTIAQNITHDKSGRKIVHGLAKLYKDCKLSS